MAYFCPNTIVFGNDMDAILVRPTLRIPDIEGILSIISEGAGLRWLVSDKGFYAQETIRKFGGLEETSWQLRAGDSRKVWETFISEDRKGRAGESIGVKVSGRRYLDHASLVKLIGNVNAATKMLDDLVAKGVLYRGFIFKCQYCRNSEWYAIEEVNERFTCGRCHREQIYTSRHWKSPEQPSWFHQLDEVIYQGLRSDMHVPLLAIDVLRRRSESSFLHLSEIEFFRNGASTPWLECDICCIVDGVLTLGEAKTTDRLDTSRKRESEIVERYRELALLLGARKFVIATQCEAWDSKTESQVRDTMRKGNIETVVLTGSDLS